MREEEIAKIISAYKIKREKEYKNYHEKLKLDENYMKINRENAKKHYSENREKYKNKYQENKEICRAKSSLSYYKKNHNLDIFIKKCPQKYELLKEKGFLK